MANNIDGATVVVGAGLAGLASAASWAEKKEPVILVEKAEFVGGMAISVKEEGFIFDLGPHFLPDGEHRQSHWVRKLFSPEELIQIRPRIHMVVGGRWVRYPVTPASVLRIPPSVQLGFVMHRLFNNRGALPETPKWSFQEHMSNFYGRDLYEYLFRPYVTKKFGIDVSETLHRDWWAHTEHTLGKIKRHEAWWDRNRLGKSDSLYDRAAERLRRLSRDLKIFVGGHSVTYPVGGFGTLPDRLADYAANLGVDFRLGTAVDRIECDGSKILSVDIAGERVPVRRLIWTGSPVVLSKALDLEPPDFSTLHLMIFFIRMNRRYTRRGTEVRPCDPGMAFYRGYFPETLSDRLTPGGKSALVAEIATMNLEDLKNPQARYDHVIDTCVELGLCPRDGIEGISHHVIPHCYPFYTLDYDVRLQEMYGRMAPIQNLILAGRNARFQYFNSPYALRDGDRTVNDELF